MCPHDLKPWHHDHTFGQERRRPGETRTLVVIAITLLMMVIEVAAGFLFGSMALLADGLHMASHAAALGISALAYWYARRHARDERYSFGTGKVNALGGFAGAILLAVFALLMAVHSVERMIHPVDISFNQAIFVAVLGLLVNGACALILNHRHEPGDAPGPERHLAHAFQHGHDDLHADTHEHSHAHGQFVGPDHALRAAYLHVLADALTSLLAIGALLAGKWLGMTWMDPLMGIVGALLVSHWSLGLLRSTSAVLLDQQAPTPLVEAIRQHLERDDATRLADIHLWSIGPGLYALELVIVARDPQAPDYYKARLPGGVNLAHVAVEVHALPRSTGSLPAAADDTEPSSGSAHPPGRE